MFSTSPRFLSSAALCAWLAFAQVYFPVVYAYGVADAQDANNFGASLLSGANSLPAVNSGVTTGVGAPGTFNVRDFVPGATESQAWQHANYYNNPAALKDAVIETHRDAQQAGCRSTTFVWEKAHHPVMTIEYRRVLAVQDRSPLNNALLFDASGAPLTTIVVADRLPLPPGNIPFELKVFGSDSEYLDITTQPSLGVEGRAFLYKYDRLEAPSDGTFAPTGPWLSAGVLNFTATGTAQNQWLTAGTVNAPGQPLVTLYTSLVRADTHYSAPAGPCPADPPGCTVSGVQVCAMWGYHVGSIYTHSDYQAQGHEILTGGDANFSANRLAVSDVTAAVSTTATSISNGASPVYAEVHGGGCSSDRQYTNTGVSGSVFYNAQSCSSDFLGCLGTQCHNPSAEYNGSFNNAVVGLSAIDQIQHDLTCQQTGQEPTDVFQACDVRIFRGTHQTCKVPIGNNIGLTPNCCDEGVNAANGVDLFAYFKLVYFGQKLMRLDVVQGALSALPGVPGWKAAYQGANNAVQNAIKATTKTFENAVSGFMQELGFDNAAGSSSLPSLNLNILQAIQQRLMQAFFEFLKQAFGEQFAKSVITQNASSLYVFTGPVAWILAIYYVYQILTIIGHIVFKCTEEELKLGISRGAEECLYAGTYCHNEILGICIEKRKSFCCYKSFLSRLFMQEFRVNQNIGGGLFRWGQTDAENPYCDGLSVAELQSADWSKLDLTPYINKLKSAGVIPTSTY